MTRQQLYLAFGVATCLLTISSFVLVLKGASDEPYGAYRAADAFQQVVLGTACIVFWLCFSIALVALVASRQMSRKWLFMLVWASICIFYLKDCPLGYLWDLEHIILPAAKELQESIRSPKSLEIQPFSAVVCWSDAASVSYTVVSGVRL